MVKSLMKNILRQQAQNKQFNDFSSAYAYNFFGLIYKYMLNALYLYVHKLTHDKLFLKKMKLGSFKSTQPQGDPLNQLQIFIQKYMMLVVLEENSREAIIRKEDIIYFFKYSLILIFSSSFYPFTFIEYIRLVIISLIHFSSMLSPFRVQSSWQQLNFAFCFFFWSYSVQNIQLIQSNYKYITKEMISNSQAFNIRKSYKSNLKSKRLSQHSELLKYAPSDYLKKNQPVQQFSDILKVNGKYTNFENTTIPFQVVNKIQKKLFDFVGKRPIQKQKSSTKKYLELYAKRLMTAKDRTRGRNAQELKQDQNDWITSNAKATDKTLSTDGSDKLKTNQDTIRAFSQCQSQIKRGLRVTPIRKSFLCEKTRQPKPKSVEFRRRVQNNRNQKRSEQKRKFSLHLEPEYEFTPWGNEKDLFDSDLLWTTPIFGN